ncbi:YIP1 family protein [Candidatus Woesearchaeota archaeon]|nr:YIP1 family protein [Candidatus Woesearchaeota archaeon]
MPKKRRVAKRPQSTITAPPQTSYFTNLKYILTSPSAFFEATKGEGAWPSVRFWLITWLLVQAISFILTLPALIAVPDAVLLAYYKSAAVPELKGYLPTTALGAELASIAINLAALPLLIIVLIMAAAFLHLFVRLWGGTGGLVDTVSASFYAYAPTLPFTILITTLVTSIMLINPNWLIVEIFVLDFLSISVLGFLVILLLVWQLSIGVTGLSVRHAASKIRMFWAIFTASLVGMIIVLGVVAGIIFIVVLFAMILTGESAPSVLAELDISPAEQGTELLECTRQSPGNWCFTAEGMKYCGRKENCISALAFVRQDKLICEQLVSRGKDICLGTLAAAAKDTSLCPLAPSPDRCYDVFAGDTNDAAACGYIGDLYRRENCVAWFQPETALAYEDAVMNKNTALCDRLKGRTRDSCLANIGTALNDKSLCEASSNKDVCYDWYATDANDESTCDLIANDRLRADCHQWFE